MYEFIAFFKGHKRDEKGCKKQYAKAKFQPKAPKDQEC